MLHQTDSKKNILTLSSMLTTRHRILNGRLTIGRYWSSWSCLDASSYKRNHEQFAERNLQSVHPCALGGITQYKKDRSREVERERGTETSEYLLHMALGKVIDTLALSRHRNQWTSTGMPQLPVQRILKHSYTEAIGLHQRVIIHQTKYRT
jgi:hypothetical protein